MVLLPVFKLHRKTLIAISLCLLAFIGGAVRFQASVSTLSNEDVSFYRDQGLVTVSGMVAADPETGNRSTTLRVAAFEIEAGGISRQVTGDVRVRVLPYPIWRYGDLVKLTGPLERPTALTGFDYAGYLAGQGIFSVMDFPRTELTGRDQGPWLLQQLHHVRSRIADTLQQSLPEPQAGLATAILLGMRDNLSPELSTDFVATGTAHILAISGFNITVVMGMFLALAVWAIGRRRGFYVWLTVAGMWLYVSLTALQPPVIRAAIMGTVLLLAEFFGRQRSGITALAFTGAIMVAIQPQVLWQASFQLSFAAMAGLVILAPPWQHRTAEYVAQTFGRNGSLARAANSILDSLAVTVAASIAVYPLVAALFGNLSVVGLPATFFASLALSPIIATAAITALLGMVAPPLGWVAGWAAWLFLTYLTWVVQSFAALPFTSVLTAPLQLWHIWLYYVVVLGVFLGIQHRKRIAGLVARLGQAVRTTGNIVSHSTTRVSPLWLAVPLALIAALAWTAAISAPDEQLHVSFLDVGQGDAILVQTPTGQNILIDGGPGTRDVTLELGRKLPYWQRTLDAVILTQPQSDHLTGLLGVLERYNVKEVIDTEGRSSSAVFRQWQGIIAVRGIPHQTASAGQRIDFGRGVVLDILHPPPGPPDGVRGDVNNNSLVARLGWGKVSFLFTGDIGSEAEAELTRLGTNLETTVLKVSHHGSRTSTTSRFLALVAPKAAVISAGRDNQFGHPNPEVVDRLVQHLGPENVYLTADRGTIEFVTDGNRLWVVTER